MTLNTSANRNLQPRHFTDRRWAVRIGVVFAVTTLLAMLIYSPFMFGIIGGSDRAWSRLANVGQAYGGMSAILSGLALLAIAVSIKAQVDQRKADFVAADRQRHHDMMRYVFEDPMYSQCWGPKMAPEPIDDRLFYYVNIILLEWQSSWDLGSISEA